MVNWKVDPTTGWLSGVRHLESPNYDARPTNCAIDAIVIHSISMPPGECGGDDVDGLFLNRLNCSTHPFYEAVVDLRVSAHLLIRRDGSVVQYVSFSDRAWHAGVSQLMGRERVNDFSIGIELEGSEFTPFEEKQYQSLVEAARAIRKTYTGISEDRIVGHSDIAPGRKSDPGPYFNWTRFRTALR